MGETGRQLCVRRVKTPRLPDGAGGERDPMAGGILGPTRKEFGRESGRKAWGSPAGEYLLVLHRMMWARGKESKESGVSSQASNQVQGVKDSVTPSTEAREEEEIIGMAGGQVGPWEGVQFPKSTMPFSKFKKNPASKP
eukprot:GGOE01007569.1.p4 GENE.GGOE01007569.1~~GGOE01007569.1.p4  ORF type:complete len:139 (-),score=8.23 GGOE01007569.1:8-424(-)